ncbi:glycoside hydrolase family 71/99 protein [Thermococcus stetteri]|uniref:hypothetical protein n=1 Tax=Thermococcus stetteri TaxID=49900 RepID=UPI001AE8C622|nr:hypothetical protein [Thermococcus stetteri]MBP1912515.1 hypothetical protein [Thermococcus stetteri]
MNKLWSEFAKSQGLEYVASVFPGFKYYYRDVGLPRDENQFYERILNSLAYTTFIRVDTWNDFGENTFVEPSQKEGFKYFETLKDALSNAFG